MMKEVFQVKHKKREIEVYQDQKVIKILTKEIH